jgi:hypothetical protein
MVQVVNMNVVMVIALMIMVMMAMILRKSTLHGHGCQQ